jgi:1-acyl-sn-glycerol-3-phosphate acyltransferase
VVLMAVLKYRGYAYVAKSEFLGNFIMRTFLGGLGSVFVERFDVQKSAENADQLVAAARQGVSLLLFPKALSATTPAAPLPHRRLPGRGAGGIPVVP